MSVLKDKVINYVRQHGRLEFDVYCHHNGHEVELPDDLSFKSDLIDWIAYSGLQEYLISESIWYSHSGFFHFVGDQLFISVSFRGPYDEENEELPELVLTMAEVEYVIGQDDLNYCISEFEPSELFMYFDYKIEESFLSFNGSYFDGELEYDIIELFTEEQLARLKLVILKKIHDCLPHMNVFPQQEQSWMVECEHNQLHYSIFTSDYSIDYDIVNPKKR